MSAKGWVLSSKVYLCMTLHNEFTLLSKNWSNVQMSWLKSPLVPHGEHSSVQIEEKVIQEVEETVVVTLPETPKVSMDSCATPLPVPATPPKPLGPSQQAAPQTPASEGKRKPEPPAELIEVPKALPADCGEQRRMLVEMCICALFLCLSRFPQHYKSLYRLAFFYTNSKTHQVSESMLHCSFLRVFQRPSHPLNP